MPRQVSLKRSFLATTQLAALFNALGDNRPPPAAAPQLSFSPPRSSVRAPITRRPSRPAKPTLRREAVFDSIFAKLDSGVFTSRTDTQPLALCTPEPLPRSRSPPTCTSSPSTPLPLPLSWHPPPSVLTPPTALFTPAGPTSSWSGSDEADSLASIAFPTSLDLHSQRQNAVSDELEYLLDGAAAGRPSAARTAALTALLARCSSKKDLSLLRSAGWLRDIVRVATTFAPRDPEAAGCLKILTAVAADPMTSTWVGPDAWAAMLAVLDPSTRSDSAACNVAAGPGPCSNGDPPAKRAKTIPALETQRTKRLLASPPPRAGPSTPRDSTVAPCETETVEALALHALLAIISSEEPDPAAEASPSQLSSDAGAFRGWMVEVDGLRVLANLVERHTKNPPSTGGGETPLILALRLLEALTCPAPEDLPLPSVAEVCNALPPLVAAFAQAVGKSGNRKGAHRRQIRASPPVQLSLLRVLVNVTASLARTQPPRGALLSNLLATTTSLLSSPDCDVLNCSLGLLVNLTEWDGVARTIAGKGPLIPAVARVFRTHLAPGTTAGNVTASYAALLLGCLTIDHPTNRTAVLAALRSRGTPIKGNPAVRLVIVLQQFLLFQSEERLLAPSTLRGLHHVITELVAANDIAVSRR